MLLSLHVKNLALIEETEIEFGKGLNILTGETGAGKSIILGSVNLALGGKAGSDVIGRYGEFALVELTFLVEEESKIAKLQGMDIYPEDGIITISRRIMPGRSVIKINGETSTSTVVKKITEILIDIHGQHDHQSLLYKANHLEILDKYAKNELSDLKKELENEFSEYTSLKKSLETYNISEDERKRNLDFLTFEVEEIENAALNPGEDELVETQYRKIINSRKIMDELETVNNLVGNDNPDSASERIGRAYSAINNAAQYDDELRGIADQLSEIDSLLSDFNHDLMQYTDNLEFDDEFFRTTEQRLDLINNLKSKYGSSIEQIKEYCINAQNKIDFYEEYEVNYNKAKDDLNEALQKVKELCKKINKVRVSAAKKLSAEIAAALEDLNFEQVRFDIQVRNTDSITKNGSDEAEFMISVNPGEDLKPLAKIASGGELSRIMLGIKSVLAGKDDIDTLIFDEIDTGISGRTAQRVSEKMAVISAGHQVICITHLPQIAAMSDIHFLIEKNIENGFTCTSINRLSDEQIIEELGRMLGGSEINDIVLTNARQMKEQAQVIKIQCKS